MDLATQRKEWVDIGLGQPLASGVGLCTDDQFVYHVIVANADFGTHLCVLDRWTLDVVNVQPLPEIDDGHSVLRLSDELMVVSTGTDEIVAYPLRGPEVGPARVVWSPTDSGSDTHHINSLALVGDELLCSAFGPKEDDSWASARNGYIRNVTAGTILLSGLRQPHSATWHDDQLFLCNSLEGSVNRNDEVVAYLYGYTRGLAFGPDGTLYAGTSLSRRPPRESEDAGLFQNPGHDGELHGQCALVTMNVQGANRLEMAIAPFGNEIYDIVVL